MYTTSWARAGDITGNDNVMTRLQDDQQGWHILSIKVTNVRAVQYRLDGKKHKHTHL